MTTAPNHPLLPFRAFRASFTAFAAVLAGSLALFAGCGLSTGGIPLPDAGFACTESSQCDDQNPCTTDACSPAGLCVFTPVADGPAPASFQAPGDCKVIVCASGVETSENDDTDVPASPSACIADSCSMGMPVQDLDTNDMHACTLAGSPGTCSGGTCMVVCTMASQCPDEGPCTTAMCDGVSGTCSYMNLTDGSPTPGVVPVAGDCHVSICVGGVAMNEVDPSDVPTVPTAQAGCADAVCSAAGVPSVPVHPLDSACSTYMGTNPGYCDAGGDCVECVMDADCAGASDDCQHPACTASKCGVAYTATGTATSTNPPQIPGDCQQIVCDGAGGHHSVPYDTDPPNSGTVCITDSCSGGVVVQKDNPGVTCSSGTTPEVCTASGQCGCQSNGDCTLPSTCGGGGVALVCGCTPKNCTALGKTCGGPFSDGCYGMLSCNDGSKDGGETDTDCGGPATGCATRCANSKKCSAGSDCQSGFCADGVCCSTACTGSTCQACSAAAKGQGADGVCGAVKLGGDPHHDCMAQAASTCGEIGGCNGSGACSTWPAGTQCAAPSCSGNTLITPELCAGGLCTAQVPAMTDCTPYKCGGSPAVCGKSCTGDGDCVNNTYFCSASKCVLKEPAGTACTAADQCSSGVCGTTGTGNCCSAACAHLGAPCGATGCDNTGACIYPTTTCGNATCSNAVATPAPTCSGGICNPATPVPCTNGFACNGTATACATTCTAPANGCIGTDTCVGGACLLSAGQPCGANTQCASMTCDVAGSGNCCTAACTLGAPCGATSCNNSGACVYPTTACTGSSCTTDVLTTYASCNGGACTGTPTVTTCMNDLTCAGGSCPLGCGTDDAAGDANCLSGFWCDGVSPGACQPAQGLGGACDRNSQCSNPVGCLMATGRCS